MKNSSLEKIFQIDEHAGAVASGLLADARVLMTQARIKAQVYRITYEEPIDIWTLVRSIADRMQLSTLYAGIRPYGVSFLIGCVDSTGSHLMEADPSGMVYEWLAHAIGKGGIAANKILKQKWKPGISEKDAVKLAVEILRKVEGVRPSEEIEIAVIREEDKKFRRLTTQEIKKMV